MTPNEEAMMASYGALYRAWLKDHRDKAGLLDALEAIAAALERANVLAPRDSLGSLLDIADTAIAEARRETP